MPVPTASAGNTGWTKSPRLNAPLSRFREAISTPAQGNTYLDHARVPEVIALQSQHASFAPREVEMLQRLTEGEDLTDIPKGLGVSYKTVANLSLALKKKTGTQSLADLTRYAMQDDCGMTSAIAPFNTC
ncbi:LuxR C-terminal-related transcriptional regulator [Thalassococcus sp. S3]|uniref:helix-turn-helix transcriptional regulator n=1 Tax=Thalassococcus sp. S3 TaxID=2017482 RepID=UPI0013EE7EB4|nr:LuxR C-terminal-related transcriptional regulator [Thalassococcus sp. S3]